MNSFMWLLGGIVFGYVLSNFGMFFFFELLPDWIRERQEKKWWRNGGDKEMEELWKCIQIYKTPIDLRSKTS